MSVAWQFNNLMIAGKSYDLEGQKTFSDRTQSQLASAQASLSTKLAGLSPTDPQFQQISFSLQALNSTSEAYSFRDGMTEGQQQELEPEQEAFNKQSSYIFGPEGSGYNTFA